MSDPLTGTGAVLGGGLLGSSPVRRLYSYRFRCGVWRVWWCGVLRRNSNEPVAHDWLGIF
jgi:hypothetical protein